MTPEGLKEFQTHHIFLQSIRVPWKFHKFAPASIFVMKTHVYDDPLQNFDYIDNLFVADGEEFRRAPFLAIRCEGAAVACVFEDLGMTMEHLGDKLSFTEGQTLHPLQFIEVASMLAYKHSLRQFSTHYTTARVGTADAYRTRVKRWPKGQLWGEWDMDKFKLIFKKHAARYLASTEMFDTPGVVPSFLVKDGQRIVMNKDATGDLQSFVCAILNLATRERAMIDYRQQIGDCASNPPGRAGVATRRRC